MMTIECSVVIPAFNEEATLAATVAAVGRALDELGCKHEIVLVDDGAQDATWAVIVRLAAADPRVRGIRFTRNFGKEAAIRAGLDEARGRAVVVMDADAQHPPPVLAQLLQRWRAGDVDVVEAVKEKRAQDGLLRRGLSALFYRVFSGMAGFDLGRAADFKLLDRRVVDHYRQLPEADLFFRGLTVWMGFRTARVGFAVAPRAAGSSAWSLRALLRLARGAITSFTAAPLHLVTMIGVGFIVFALLLGGQTLWRWINGEAVEGFTTVILVVLVTGSALMIGMGVIGEYVARIYDEVKRRPRFLVSERTASGDDLPGSGH